MLSTLETKGLYVLSCPPVPGQPAQQPRQKPLCENPTRILAIVHIGGNRQLKFIVER